MFRTFFNTRLYGPFEGSDRFRGDFEFSMSQILTLEELGKATKEDLGGRIESARLLSCVWLSLVSILRL